MYHSDVSPRQIVRMGQETRKETQETRGRGSTILY